MSESELKRSRSKAVPKTSKAVLQLALLCIIGVGLLAYGVLRIIDAGFSNWVSVVMSLIGLLLLAMAISAFRSFRLALELDSSGSTAEGVIIGKRSKTDSEGDRTCYVAYQFGEDYGAEQQVSASAYWQLQVGDTVEVCYLPRDPNISRMEI